MVGECSIWSWTNLNHSIMTILHWSMHIVMLYLVTSVRRRPYKHYIDLVAPLNYAASLRIYTWVRTLIIRRTLSARELIRKERRGSKLSSQTKRSGVCSEESSQ